MINDENIEEEYPVFVCECCGDVVRALAYDEQDTYKCDFCGTVMTKTKYSLLEEEVPLVLGITRESIEFFDDVFLEYVKDSPKFDSDKLRERQVKDIEYIRQYLP